MGVNKRTIARDVAHIMELPIYRNSGKAYKIVTTVLDTIQDALSRGESVRILNFGTFSVRDCKAHRTRVTYQWPHLSKKMHREVFIIPAKKRVIFTPSKAILEPLNREKA